MARLDRLTAVTMCVNYADFLAQTVSNRNYFDEWIVVTCREDHATRELCVRHGIRVHLSGQLGPWGDCFDSAYLKAPVINEVLSRLPQEGWVLLLDADLLLPQRFRERLGNYSLYPRALYGMYGRRECDSWEEYTWRRPVEPWAENIGYSSSVLGYFQLFRLDQPINRYPYARPKLEMHDDLCFQYGFKATLRRLLPMEGLHVGPPRVNWSGRHSGAFSGETEQVPARRVPQVLEHLKKVEVLWVIGADESMPWAVLAARAGKLVVVDWYGLEAEIDAAIVQADRRLLRKRLGEHWESLGLSPVLIPAERTRMEAAMETAPADAVFFVPELSADMAAALGPLFLKKGRKWPVLLGQFYGFPQWRSTALSVSVFFGVPDEVYTDGSWIVRNPVGMPMLRSGETKDMEGVTMVVFCGNPGQVATLGEWVASGLRIPATQIAVFVRRHPHDGFTVALSAMTGIKMYDMPQASGPATEALRVEDLGLLARFPGERVVLADLEMADREMLNGLLSGGGGFFHAGGVLWGDCARKEQEAAAAVVTEILGRPVSAEELAAYPADLAALHYGARARVIDLWQGLAEAARICGATRPVFTGLAAACLLAEVKLEQAAETESAALEAPSILSRPPIKVRAGSGLVFVIDPTSPDWSARAEALRNCDAGWLGALVPKGEGQVVESTCPGLFHTIMEADVPTGGDAAIRWLLDNAHHQLPGTGVIFLSSADAAFPGAALLPYAQFDGFDLVMEMDVPPDRRDLGPADGKPSLSGPVFLSAKLMALITAKPLPSRVGWRIAVLRAARKAHLPIMLRHAGASGWHPMKETL